MEMNCQQVCDAMADHSVGLLKAATASAYEAHLAACPVCAAEARRFARCLTLLDRMPRHDAPADLWLGLRARLELERSVRDYTGRGTAVRLGRSWWTGAVAAGAGFACALMVILGSSPRTLPFATPSTPMPASVASANVRNGVDSDSPMSDAASSAAVDATTVRPLPDLSVALARFEPETSAQPSYVPTEGALR